MVQVKLDQLSFIPSAYMVPIWWKEGTNFQKLSSDFRMCTVAQAHIHTTINK